MFVREEDVEADELAHEVVPQAVPQVPDAVDRGCQVGTRRVDRQAYGRHPSVEPTLALGL